MNGLLPVDLTLNEIGRKVAWADVLRLGVASRSRVEDAIAE